MGPRKDHHTHMVEKKTKSKPSDLGSIYNADVWCFLKDDCIRTIPDSLRGLEEERERKEVIYCCKE